VWYRLDGNGPLALSGICLFASAFTLAESASLPSPTIALAYGSLTVSGLVGALLAWKRRDRTAIALVAGFGVAARLALFASPPIFSHDVYRYLWDGRVMLAGLDPLALAPRDPLLAHLAATPLFAYVDYRSIPSLYPPFAYALFYVGAFSSGVYGEKLVMLGGDLIALGLVLVTLHRRVLPLGRATVYAWSPLVLLEFAQNGHLESWAVAAVLVTALALTLERRALAAVALTCATLVKLTPAAFIPLAFARAPRWALACVTACAAVYAVAYAVGVPLPHSLGNYISVQRFFPTAFRAVGPLGSGLIFVAVVAFATWRRRATGNFATGVIAIQLAFMLCTPNALPWYATLIPAAVPLVDDRGRAESLTLAALIVVASILPLAYGPPIFPATGDVAIVIAVLAAAVIGVVAVILRAPFFDRRTRSVAIAQEIT